MSLHPKPASALDPQQQARLQRLSFDFARAWQAASSWEQFPPLDRFLPPQGDPLRRPALEMLLLMDLEERWRKQQFILLEQYVDRFPELGSVPQLPARLLLEEFRIRHQFGDQPPLSTYQRRFPTQFPELQRLIQGDSMPTVRPDGSSPGGQAAAAAQVLPISAEYVLLERIGKGSYGEVWRAQGPGGFDVALKVIPRPAEHEDVKRELQSLEAIKRLRHPFLLPTIAYWQLADRLLIAMELADETLHQRLQKCKQQGSPGIPLDELIGYFRDAAEALDYLHQNKVLHRDVKPANLLLLQGHVKVADFGLARLVGGGELSDATFCGTPLYIAPEVWEGKIGPASDLYSLAITYVELRLGRRPFSGRTLPEMKLEHREGIPDLEPLGIEEQRVVLKALGKQPELRHRSCREFVAELEAAVRVLPTRKEGDRGAGATMSPGDQELPDAPSADSQMPSMIPGSTLKPPPSRLPTYILFAALVVALGWLGAWALTGRNSGGFTLEMPPRLSVVQGQTARLGLAVHRDHFDSAIRFSFEGLPKGVSIEEAWLGGSEEVLRLELKADGSAKADVAQVTVRAEGDGVEREAKFELTVIGLALPARCRPLGDDYVVVNRRAYYSRVEYVRGKGEPTFEFVLVQQGRYGPEEVDLPTYYIMADKVSVAQFRRFADARQITQASKDWNRHDPEDCPAVRVAGVDAYEFATRWIEGGQLPTIAQWEKAAGRYADPPREGPYDGTWGPSLYGQVAVSPESQSALTRPMKRREAKKDVSVFGCWDMSGNGLEWTRNASDDSVGLITEANRDRMGLVWTRGMDFAAPFPFQFKQVPTNVLAMAFRNKPDSPTGFRVVLAP